MLNIDLTVGGSTVDGRVASVAAILASVFLHLGQPAVKVEDKQANQFTVPITS